MPQVLSVAEFGQRVAACQLAEDNPKFSIVADLIPVVLEILFNMPCFKSASPEKARQRIEDQPLAARMFAKSVIRSKASDTWIKSQAGSIADDMLHVMTLSKPIEFAAVYAAVRPASPPSFTVTGRS